MHQAALARAARGAPPGVEPVRRSDGEKANVASVFAHHPEVPRVEVTGMALPILRETKMTTVRIEHGNLSEQVLHQAITAFEGVVGQVIHSSE